MPNLPKTVVEFVDTKSDGTLHVPNEIRVNGSPVLVEDGSAEVIFGSGNAVTRVRLTLLVGEVHFTHSATEGGL